MSNSGTYITESLQGYDEMSGECSTESSSNNFVPDIIVYGPT